MKKTFLFLLSFIAVLLLAVFISPLLFHVLPYKFERIFNRIVMIGTLICVAAFVRIRRENLSQYGLLFDVRAIQMLSIAFICPVVVLSIYVALQSLFGEAVYSLQPVGAVQWINRICGATLTGLLIGTIEELFFRGVVFHGLKSFFKNRLVVALILTNAFYSIVHFVNAKKPFIDQSPTFMDSLRVLGAPLQSLVHFGNYWPGFVGLFIFGLMLTGLLLRTKSLYPAIGLHAGAVFFIKTDGLLVDFGQTNLIWGSSKMYDGIAGWLALITLYFVLTILLKKSSTQPPSI